MGAGCGWAVGGRIMDGWICGSCIPPWPGCPAGGWPSWTGGGWKLGWGVSPATAGEPVGGTGCEAAGPA
jgi:hypothetical protein